MLGTNYGPRSPGTVFTLLYRLAAAAGADGGLAQPAGGLGALSEALARAARAAGAEIRTGAAVGRILVRDDRAAGVVLACGEQITARAVVSSADPKTTFLRLLGSEHLDAGFVRRIVHLRSRGLAAKLHLALEGLPRFAGLDAAALRGRLLFAPSPEHIERAYNHAKYGEFSSRPMLEVTVPTLADPALAPPGKHVISVIAQYAPYALSGGWADGRARFTDLLIDTLAALAPGLRAQVVHADLLTPRRTSSASSASRAATGTTPSSRSISSSCCGRCRASPSTVRRSAVCTCAAPAAIPAAASWDSPDATLRARS